MDRIREYIEIMMKRLAFPDDAQCEFLQAYDKVTADEVAGRSFVELIEAYNRDENCDYKQMDASAAQLGEQLHIHAYTMSLLLLLCMSKTLLDRYIERNIPEHIYYETIKDLAYKLEECRLVYGINGTFVASWFSGFFALTRFGLGRLQFEIVEAASPMSIDGMVVPAGTKAINVHIPRTGTRLRHEEVLESYRMAAEMFATEFGQGPILFVCKSWLLDPWNLTVLKPDSNLAQFCKDFKVVMTGEYEDYRELWRLFDCEYTGDPAKLPRDSSLRCAYADRVARGEPIGWGFGIFFHQHPAGK